MAITDPISKTQSMFVQWINDWVLESPPPIYSLLNENQIQSIHQDVSEDPIRINLMDSLESNQALLSDWLLVVGNGEDVI